ncbi:Acyl-CoA synthetase member 3, mitochondrial [Blyttiomyces sp. JEL0837]|nr:Acyl-CoA synthetase member 3, mitochondrial [Blyttiomyces sp. JEL0837]
MQDYSMILHSSEKIPWLIRPGDRIAFLVPRSYLYPTIQWSIWSLQAIAVPLCTSHPPAELAHVISDCGASTVIYHPSFHQRITDTMKDDRVVKIIDGMKWISTNDSVLKDVNVVDTHKFKEFEVSLTDLDKSQGALIVYTSGTTGRPKGVLTTFGNVEAQVESLLIAWRWTKEDRIQLVLPLHHVHGIINVVTCALASGATIENTPKKFDPSTIWKRWITSSTATTSTPSHPPLTLFMAVPTIYAKLSQHFHDVIEKKGQDDVLVARKSCEQFRLMVSGSAALPKPLFDDWVEVSGHRLLERYGMTEIGMALGNPYDGPREPGSVGIPFPNVQVKLISEKGKDVTDVPCASGELYVKGPQVFKEYWGRPEATAESFREGGWFQTGDIATKSRTTKTFKILGRASVDIIKSGGYKLSALIIEREILSHPNVSDVAVFGIDDPVWGEKVVALIVWNGDNHGDEAVVGGVLKEFLKGRLAPYEIPAVFRIVKELPRNAMGKVNKKELKKGVVAELPRNAGKGE